MTTEKFLKNLLEKSSYAQLETIAAMVEKQKRTTWYREFEELDEFEQDMALVTRPYFPGEYIIS